MTETYVGVMTGNSLDAADVVLTRFEENGEMTDVATVSVPYPKSLSDGMRAIRAAVAKADGAAYDIVTRVNFLSVVTAYTRLVAEAVFAVVEKAGCVADDVVAIGLHGQTCAHCPPSVAGKDALPYTLQIGHPKLLARLTGIPVVYDFRSDDIFNGGEGAPFAPLHNAHMARSCGFTGTNVFCNAGNTGNIAFVTDGKPSCGFDVGSFNHFPDFLMRTRKGMACDENGAVGLSGKVRKDILDILFMQSCLTADGRNFYDILPPKSADPQWYTFPEKLNDFAFEDVVCTAEYLGAYGVFYALSQLPENIAVPERFVLFGGGWKNPVCRKALEDLIHRTGTVLPRHERAFSRLYARLPSTARIETTEAYGLSPQYTEARIFADAAYCFVHDKPFTVPETTGCFSKTVCGVYCLPDAEKEYALTELTQKTPVARPLLYSRASKL